MNLKRLEYFVTLAQVGNVRRAAEMLHVSPPALSKAMKILEDELEAQLWMKDGRNIILSDTGKSLLKKAPRLMADLKDLKDSLRADSEGKKETLKIGSFEVFSTYFLSFLKLEDLGQRSLELHELLPGELERFVASGELDFGITYMPIPNPDLDFMKVLSLEMGVFVRAGSFVGVEQINLPYVVPVMPLTGVPTKIRGLDGWPENAYQRKVAHQVTLMESALELCRQGRVAGYFPAFIVREHNKRFQKEFHLERRRSPGVSPCYSDVYIVKRKSYKENALIKKMAKSLRLICGS